MRLSPFRLGLCVVVLLSLSGCASSGAGQRPPDVALAQTTTDIIGADTKLQLEVNRLTAARALPVAIGQKFTDANKIILAKGMQLSTALDAYHAATSLGDRSVKAGEVQALITELSGPISELLGLKLPAGAAQSISKLIGNVMAVVGAIQGEVAKGLQGGAPSAALWRPQLVAA